MEATTDAVAQAEAAVELGIETLRGDIRDRILDNICRQMPCWTKMSEHEQRTMIGRADDVAGRTVREAIRVVAHQGFDQLVVSTGKWTVKDGLKLEVGASGSVDDITKPAVLVLAEPGVFFGQRADALADKDQPELPIADEDGVIAQDGDDEDGEVPEAEEGEDEADRSPLPEPPARVTRTRRSREPADA
ncbi:hypothetical protein [Methylobacterium sp. NEAU K]|uniref:hypothetical protein n=1 Tax=Methylobacterium sp. NEAU K TaxID=3064946 RepID=UPI002732677D|nr:hypothetical protein [Methylobacterium sp. NEAU K]MDP4005095.1 hypothetical protein [Methylobacterium sp. NEAU K]